jgi:hypothetical protein
MNRLALCTVAALLSACVGEPPAPLALAPPPTAPEPASGSAAPAVPESIVTAPAAPAEAEEPARLTRPPQTGHGQWCIVVVSERKAEDTKPWMKRLAGAGFRVEVEPADVGGTTWYRVLLPGYRADGEARAALAAANEAAGVKDSFIWRRKKAAAPAPAAEPPPAEKPAPEAQPAN